jgi:adenine phosphoribosyltransferase
VKSTLEPVRARIRQVPDFPTIGILFYDVSPVLRDPETFRDLISSMAGVWCDARVDLVVGIESRGFVFGAPVALEMNVGFVPIRKLGKLPGETVSVSYDLEYGSNVLEMQRDSIQPGQRVLIVDDVLATGGTMAASAAIVDQLGGETVGGSVVIELDALRGRQRLEQANVPLHSLFRY